MCVMLHRISAVIAATITGAALLTGCSSSPEVCGVLRPAVQEIQAASKAFSQSSKRKDDGQVYLAAQFKYRSVLAALSEGGPAREAGLSSSLENFAAFLTEDSDEAAALTTLAAVDIERVCGFSPWGSDWYEKPL
jgi:hypothetical protein